MRKLFSIAFAAVLLYSCTNGQTSSATKTNLSAAEFSEKIKTLSDALIIDVRTAEEFTDGHIQNALNYDWNGNGFEKQIATLDKTKPVFVYCLSGGRSSAAANHMRESGFKEVYELQGGMMKWRGANLPETTENTVASKGMTKQEFEGILNSDKLVLIDYYADWCIPCKKMKPYLDEISKDMANKVVVVRINADENNTLCKELKIDALPVLQLYKNKTLTWTYKGFIEKEEVVKQLH